MCEDGGQESKVEAVIRVGEPEVLCCQLPVRVVKRVEYVSMSKSEPWRKLRNVILTPFDAFQDDVEAFVTAACQISRQRLSHSSTATAHFENAIGRLQGAISDYKVQAVLADHCKAFRPAAAN